MENNTLTGIERELVLRYLIDGNVPVTVTPIEKEDGSGETVKPPSSAVFPVALKSEQFASGGGPSYVLQPTFGYLVGFICQAYLTGALVRGGEPTFGRVLGACLAGMAIVYLFGISYFYIASNYIVDAPITLWLALWYCGILQVVPDFLLCLAAAFIGIRCRKAGLWL